MPHSQTYIKQGTQRTYNTTLRRIHATIFAVENN